MSTTLTPPVHGEATRGTPEQPPSHDRTPLVTLGAILMLLGLGWLADALGAVDFRWQTVLAVGLLAVGVALLATASRAGHAGLVVLGIVLSLLLISTTAAREITVVEGIGARDLRPQTMGDVQEAYELGAGQFVLDLRALDLPVAETPIAVEVGTGEIIVRLPERAAAEIHASSGIGDVEILGLSRGGMGVDVRQSIPGSEGGGRLLLDLSVGMGRIEVSR